MTELSPHDALLLASNLAAIRSHCALVELGARYRRMGDVQKLGFAAVVPAALASLGRLFPGDDGAVAQGLSVKPGASACEPSADLRAVEQLRQSVARRAVTLVHAGGIAERAFVLGLGVGEVLVAARTANFLGRVLATDGPGAGVEAERAEALEVLASARESAKGSLARLASGLRDQEVSPAAREATTILADRIGAEPSRFDAKDERPDQEWCQQVEGGTRGLLVALSYPAEPPVLFPESPEERAALEEILRHPEDDAPRLRWATLAAARHDLRAVLVREQLAARAKQHAFPDLPSTESGLTRFLLRTHPEWLDDARRRLGAESAAFHGGFVEEITISASSYLENGPTLLQKAPLRRLRLTEVAPLLDALLASATLDPIVWLDLAGQELDDTHVDKLARATGLRALRALSLGDNRITDAGVRALWASPTLTKLVYCGLDGNPCTPVANLELTPDEMSQYEWEYTELSSKLKEALGSRRWVIPWRRQWPPSLDAVVGMDRKWPVAPTPAFLTASTPARPPPDRELDNVAWSFTVDFDGVESLKTRLGTVWPTPWATRSSDTGVIAAVLTEHAAISIHGHRKGHFVAFILLRTSAGDAMAAAKARLFQDVFAVIGAREVKPYVEIMAWSFKTDLRSRDDLKTKLDPLWPRPWRIRDSDSKPDAIDASLTQDAWVRIDEYAEGVFVATIDLRRNEGDRPAQMETARALLFREVFPVIGARDVMPTEPVTD